MQFSQYTWNLYKQSEKGKEVISYFEYDTVFLNDVEILNKYNPVSIIEPREYKNLMQQIGETLAEKDNLNFKDFQELRIYYENLIEYGVFYEYNQRKNYIIEVKDYDFFLGYNHLISFFFYACAYDFCFPNLFIYRFFDLNKIADAFNIELPSIPKKSDKKGRCMYYLDLCETFYNFRINNSLSPNELCAFLYDFAPNFIKQEKQNTNLPAPTQAWFIGGILNSKYDFEEEKEFWQCNAETKKGDILVHYQTAPVSAITHIWRATTNGVIDPFFYYYANSYLTNPIEIPPISLKELKADVYFANHSLVCKSFQGVNGWSMTNEDYTELLRIIKSKGFDVSILPMPYAPDTPKGIEIKVERDVEINLLEFYLKDMGFVENQDYIRQLPIKAGRGSRVYPDYALHYENTKGYEKASILIEAKLYMKNNKEVEDCFKQARSYANVLEAHTIILCDKKSLIVYEKENSFDRNNYTKIYWEELKNPDKYNQLKKILENR